MKLMTLNPCFAVFLVSFGLAATAQAKPHDLRQRGRTLVEAEAYSDKSSDSPKVQESAKCSGKKCLGYFWANEWFELQVNVPRSLLFDLALRASSVEGTQLKVQRIGDDGSVELLATIDVPKTGTFDSFRNIAATRISLPEGAQTLRIENTASGVDIDHFTFTAGSVGGAVTTYPTPNAGPDTNPLKGLKSGWWREDDSNASVGFQYIEWGRLEPVDDQFDWDYVEEVLDRPGTRGRHFILQFAVDWDDWGQSEPKGDSHYRGPDWLLKEVGENRGRAFPDDKNSRISRATNYNHPAFIDEATEAINALSEYFRDDPRAFVIQTGLVGYWGEWHTFPRTDWSPTDATKRSILDAYEDALGENGLTQIRYPDEAVAKPRLGMGYTNGSVTLTDHGREFGQLIEAGGLWKNGPVGGEWPPNVDQIHWKNFFQTDAGRSLIEQGHYSTVLLPQAKEIAEKLRGWKPDERFLSLHRRLGYNFQAKVVHHIVAKDGSGRTRIKVELVNTGIAPFYKNWKVQLAILNADTNQVVDLIETETDLRKLMPSQSIDVRGDSTVGLDSIGRYLIGLRIVQPGATASKPVEWKLQARNTYVVLANDVEVVEGKWDQQNALNGGWNILDDIQTHSVAKPGVAHSGFRPLEGSFRAAGE